MAAKDELQLVNLSGIQLGSTVQFNETRFEVLKHRDNFTVWLCCVEENIAKGYGLRAVIMLPYNTIVALEPSQLTASKKRSPRKE